MPAPGPLHGEAAVYDQSAHRLLVFGGSTPERVALAGTLAWQDERWSLVADSASGPAARAGAVMAYDPVNRQVVLHGGFRLGTARGEDGQLCDTWTLRGSGWSRVSDGPCLTSRWPSFSLVYSTRERAMLLVDGPAVGRDTALRPMRIWKWTEHEWRLVDSTGPRRVGFSRVAFDEQRQVLVVPVLFGGPDAGVWEWDGTSWRHARVEGPSHRQTYGLVYDSIGKRIVLGGGQGATRGPYYDDFWSWDGQSWSKWPELSIKPPGRGGGNLIFDPAGNRFLYYGGYDTGPLKDLWAFESGSWRRLDR
jgi:hypothetical protein